MLVVRVAQSKQLEIAGRTDLKSCSVLTSASRNDPILPPRVTALLYDDICAARALSGFCFENVVAFGALGLVESAEVFGFAIATLPSISVGISHDAFHVENEL